MSNNGFTIIPNKLIDMLMDEHISRNEYIIMTLAFKFNSVGYFEASTSYLEKATGLSNRPVIEAVKNLVEKNLLTKITRRDIITGNFLSTHYKIASEPEWMSSYKKSNDLGKKGNNINPTVVSTHGGHAKSTENKEITTSSGIGEEFSKDVPLSYLPEYIVAGAPVKNESQHVVDKINYYLKYEVGVGKASDYLNGYRGRKEKLQTLACYLKDVGIEKPAALKARDHIVKESVNKAMKNKKDKLEWTNDIISEWDQAVEMAYLEQQPHIKKRSKSDIYTDTEINPENLI